MAIASGLHGQRNDVGRIEDARGSDLAADVGEQHAVAVLVEIEIAAGVLDRLEGHAAHAGIVERVADDAADLVVVDALLHDADERRGDPFPLEIGQRILAHAPQVGAAEIFQRRALARIELQIDLEAGLQLGEPRHEILVARDAHAVRVQHDVADRLRLRELQDLEDLRMDRGLAAADLHEIGQALALDERLQHRVDLGQAAVLGARGRGLGEAHRTGEIALLVDLDQREAGMLLVVGAQAAIVGAAVMRAALELERHVAGLEIVLAALEIGRIGRDQRLLRAVLGAALQVEDVVAFDQDLRRHELETIFAERRGLAVEAVVFSGPDDVHGFDRS